MISKTEDTILDMLMDMENYIKKVKAKLGIYKNITIN